MYIALLLNRQRYESEATPTCPYLFEALTVLHTKVVLSYVCYAEFDPLRFADWAIGRSPLCPQLVRVSRHQGHLPSAVLLKLGRQPSKLLLWFDCQAVGRTSAMPLPLRSAAEISTSKALASPELRTNTRWSPSDESDTFKRTPRALWRSDEGAKTRGRTGAE